MKYLKWLENKWVKLFSGAVMVSAGSVEVMEDIVGHDIAPFGIHHAIVLYGALHLLHAIVDVVEGVEVVKDVEEKEEVAHIRHSRAT